MPAKIVRKVLRSGDSKVTALPPDWARMFDISIGDTVEVVYNAIVIIKPLGFKLDPEFLKKEFDLILQLEKEKAEAEDHERREARKNHRGDS